LSGFRGMLGDIGEVLVDLNCHLLRAVFAAES
jgi:uncharacterized protein (DUF934 family)